MKYFSLAIYRNVNRVRNNNAIIIIIILLVTLNFDDILNIK